MSFRKFVNLVSSDSLKKVYALRRVDMSRFFPTAANGTMKQQQDSALPGPVVNLFSRFFPSAANGTLKQRQQDSAANGTLKQRQQDFGMPDPVINFYSPQDVNGCGDMDFMLVDDKVVATDGTGRAYIYDTDNHAVCSLPGSHAPFKAKFTTSLTVGSNLYVIDRLTNGTGNRRNFEALVYSAPPPRAKQGSWDWRALPPPPPPPCIQEQDDDRTNIESCAAFADGSHIWMSASSRGRSDVDQSCTHLFDTEGLLWSKQPAEWLLPFTGSAQYVPELQNLWFGISSWDHGHAFCAADLATASLSQPPTMRNVFDDDMSGVPNDCLIMANAVHLGSGRFCIARFYRVLKKPDNSSPSDRLGTFYSQLGYDEELFVVVAGVEVVSGGDGELSLVKHHSERYMIFDYELHWVL